VTSAEGYIEAAGQFRAVRELPGRFADACEGADMVALAKLLAEDAALEMPPETSWLSGRDAVIGFLGAKLLVEPRLFRLVRVAANGQPGFGAYLRGPGGSYRAHAVIVLTLRGVEISRITIFRYPRLFELFGLPSDVPNNPVYE
jgi:RNA polymerase sigma-70 factor (ECF subfamily)